MLKATLEQMRMFCAVAEHGSYQQAADAVFKTPGSLHHAVQKLEAAFGVELLTVEGRKSVLTADGEVLYRRVRHLLAEADSVQQVADVLGSGTETRLRLAIDQAFPTDSMYPAIDELMRRHPLLRLDFQETVLGGAIEMLTDDEADIAIGPDTLPGALNEELCSVRFVAVASPSHRLFATARELAREDLVRERQVVLRDSARDKRRDAGWLGAEQRRTVSHLSTSIELIRNGFGFAWLPEHRIRRELEKGELTVLPLAQGRSRHMTFYLNFRDADALGPAARDFLLAVRTLLPDA